MRHTLVPQILLFQVVIVKQFFNGFYNFLFGVKELYLLQSFQQNWLFLCYFLVCLFVCLFERMFFSVFGSFDPIFNVISNISVDFFKYSNFKRNQHDVLKLVRGRSRATATSKMERFVIIVNGFIITKCSVLDVAAVLDPPLLVMFFSRNIEIFETKQKQTYSDEHRQTLACSQNNSYDMSFFHKCYLILSS